MVSRTVLWLWLLAGLLLVTGSTADTQPISLTLSILAYNRPASLQRLLKSLIQADYDTVGLPEEGLNVNIFLDAAKEGSWRREKDNILLNREMAMAFVDEWPYGSVTLHVRSKNAGLAHQWFELWYPVTDHEYTLVLEDDLEVSPQFYTWLNHVVSYYSQTFDGEEQDLVNRMAGVTLQKAEVIAAQAWSPFQEADTYKLPPSYGFQQPGSWGQLFFPAQWRDFRDWLEAIEGDADAYHDDKRPFRLPGSPSHTGDGGSHLTSVWTAAWMRFLYERGYYVLYSHSPPGYSLCINHLEPGEHYSELGVVTDKLLTSFHTGPASGTPDAIEMVAGVKDALMKNIGALTYPASSSLDEADPGSEGVTVLGSGLLELKRPALLDVYDIWGLCVNCVEEQTPTAQWETLKLARGDWGRLLEYPKYNEKTYTKGLNGVLKEFGLAIALGLTVGLAVMIYCFRKVSVCQRGCLCCCSCLSRNTRRLCRRCCCHQASRDREDSDLMDMI